MSYVVLVLVSVALGFGNVLMLNWSLDKVLHKKIGAHASYFSRMLFVAFCLFLILKRYDTWVEFLVFVVSFTAAQVASVKYFASRSRR
ncbi:MAG: hypothetical protein LBT92_02680 [Rickettsiales bacterium]|jgi:hypothetical protein|nr:hypothetical protein [Rickettsiales bacterium]